MYDRKSIEMISPWFLCASYLQFPPGFAAGDVGNQQLDLKLSNSVFNTLKQHMYREERQSHRLHEKKEHSTHVRPAARFTQGSHRGRGWRDFSIPHPPPPPPLVDNLVY